MNHSSYIIVTVYCIANVFNKIEYVIHNEVLKMKAGKTLSIRISADEQAKLEAMQEKTHLSQSQIVKEFIRNGKVNVQHDGKKLIRELTSARIELNNTTLKLEENLEQISANTLATFEKISPILENLSSEDSAHLKNCFDLIKINQALIIENISQNIKNNKKNINAKLNHVAKNINKEDTL